MPSGSKLEFQDLERIKLEVKEAGLIKDDSREEIQILSKKGILTAQENPTMRDIISTLNRAAHLMELDQITAEWIIDNGPQIIDSLDSKLPIRGGVRSHSDPNTSKNWIEQSFENKNWISSLEWSDHIENHKQLWDTEIDNLCTFL